MRLVTKSTQLIALAAAVLLPSMAAAQGPQIVLGAGQTLLQVEAEGQHMSRPDVMRVTAGVTAEGATAGEALRANSAQVQRLIAAIRALGIEPRDTQTNNLRVSPRFAPAPRGQSQDDDDDRMRRIIGYRAVNSLVIRLRDLNRAPEVIDALVQAGATDLSGPSFSLSDERPALAAAQAEAVRLARVEAETYAAALGMRVARVLRVSERRRGWDDSYESIVVTGSRIAMPPIEPGEVPTSVTVWVDFALEPAPR